MSVILIKHHNENIYEAVKKDKVFHRKEPRYVSRYRDSILLEYQKVKRRPHATMGLPERPLPSASNYLKKTFQVRDKVKIDKTTATWSLLQPVVPTSILLKEDKERRKNLPPQKNFIHVNIKKAITQKPKEPEEKMVLDRFGTSKKMSAGLEPVYIYKDTFGKIPKYLKKFIREREKALLLQKDLIGTDQPKCRYITEEQRELLLKGLKENWEELQKSYQGLPILIDTIPKKHRKVKLEEELKKLEKDIVLVETHPYIYVYDDNDLIDK
ncbi:hypothetical protein FQR65_LT10476 [Abscondita terminalis]|nr:hypothetical protein FQR65_LT10476 [Abscondita terminalis]